MANDITIAAEPRTLRGKNEARRLRAAGSAPAVVYGARQGRRGGRRQSQGNGPDPAQQDRPQHHFSLAIKDGENTPVMIVDWQRDPVKDTILHIDMKRIDLSMRLVVKVPVHTVGEPEGVKLQGGLHEVITREIEVECLPNEIPDELTIDVSKLAMGQAVRASDWRCPGRSGW